MAVTIVSECIPGRLPCNVPEAGCILDRGGALGGAISKLNVQVRDGGGYLQQSVVSKRARRQWDQYTGLSAYRACASKKRERVMSMGERASRRGLEIVAIEDRPLVIGVAADSGCGKSTCTRRICSVFGASAAPPANNPNSNTLVSDMVTLICLDDYHSLGRHGRSKAGLTALNPAANDFDLMYEQVKALKEGRSVYKPIYNHVTGEIDPPEHITPPKILILDGLLPFHDPRIRELLDFSVYLDISNTVKYAWKIDRDCRERNETEEFVRQSIAKREPDFKQYIDPQKQFADVVIEVLPTQLIKDDSEFKVLRVRMVMREDTPNFTPVYLIDEGSTVSWTPCGTKLTCPYPGIRFHYGPSTWFDHPVSILEVDGQFDDPRQLLYVEQFLLNTSAKYLGEVRDQMVRNATFPGSKNGTGFFQTLVALKIRDVYEKTTGKIFPSIMPAPAAKSSETTNGAAIFGGSSSSATPSASLTS